MESYADIGRMLREARLAHRLDITQIAPTLHIRAHYLRALEEGRTDVLPGLAYAKGYLQRYAVFLEMDAPAIVEAFEKVGQFPAHKLFYLPGKFKREPLPGNRLVAGSLGFAFLLMFGWLLFHPRPPMVLAVESNATFKKTIQQGTPLRCWQRETPQWPCFWEDFGLWYSPFAAPKPTVMALPKY